MGALAMNDTSSDRVTGFLDYVPGGVQTAAVVLIAAGGLTAPGSGGTPQSSACSNSVWVAEEEEMQSASDHLAKWQQWFAKLESLSRLDPGWDGGTAPIPNQCSVDHAHAFVQSLQQHDFHPTRLGPSVVGGIGLSFRAPSTRKVYVEFRNSGKIHSLFSDGVNRPIVQEVMPDLVGHRLAIKRIREYLDEQDSRRHAAEQTA